MTGRRVVVLAALLCAAPARARAEAPAWLASLSVERRQLDARLASGRRSSASVGALVASGGHRRGRLAFGAGLGIGALDVDGAFGALAGPAALARLTVDLLEHGPLRLGVEGEGRFCYLSGELGTAGTSGRLLQGQALAVGRLLLGSVEPWLAAGYSRGLATLELPSPASGQDLDLTTPWPVDLAAGAHLYLRLSSAPLAAVATIALVLPRPQDWRVSLGVAF